MKLLAVLIIGIFVIAGFNLATMDHHNACPFDSTIASDCALVRSSFDSATSHLSAFSQLSLATILVTFSLLLLPIFLFFLRTYSHPGLSLSFLRERSRNNKTPLEQRLRFWFSLHENSPTVSLGRA
ncbi:MAG: hypothetical protein A3G02_01480 [Candidatus Yanofskybacteria bacterium RIFCSPLOWO2_12_FULL_44_13b]|uniref:Uncharacterized protein n=1 Tax=Candidatus Yanofskybacteria bacterium RIFCSPLOWO2_02_FULL_44_18 TaxID=1802705 RepID=A0A1F8H098_9BACT|nr:MAG: hypothetical protein A2657_00830 [Candidatus Yanofskybacteria bacterium RIFCSPHIGHO2_01_FULL_44_110b]OGN14237.1 MAG: hypothetical protein A3C01_01420 [Candidatus Yanofskybacteria bacterium RIFCSPHIGHO2_02_FULL_44_36b]OGN18595.1 MAG: hypothetical protein A3F50_00695 [Candidatus Yanofskybacteria bacterium RIFCSPHIGHO2_12_FULL_44_29b]OGN27115.1 MAG: hypothetical protein A3B12_02020 [Candidatus Yanofskybacteria bacterium RIFCSPLOWO2_01_FULL_44_88]OGN31103.1 MAG: hypothetical protein A3I96_0